MRGFTCLQCVHHKENPFFDFSRWISHHNVKPGERKAVRIFTIFFLSFDWDYHVKDPDTYLCRFFELNEEEIGKEGKGIIVCKIKERDIIL